MTYPVVLLVCAQSSTIMRTVYLGDDLGGFLGGGFFSTWLAMILWPFRHSSLVLYLCTSGALRVIPLYGCGSGARTSVSSGMTWGSVWGGHLFACTGFIATFDFLLTL